MKQKMEADINQIDGLPYLAFESQFRLNNKTDSYALGNQVDEPELPKNSFNLRHSKVLLTKEEAQQKTAYDKANYQTLLKEIKLKVNYCKSKYLNVRGKERKSMVQEMEIMVAEFGLGLQTFYHAVDIADRYLCKLAEKQKQAPCLYKLAITSVLIAAKLDHSQYRFDFFIKDKCGELLQRDDILEFELVILKELEYEVENPTYQDFHCYLQRFLHLQDAAADVEAAHIYQRIYMKLSLYVA